MLMESLTYFGSALAESVFTEISFIIAIAAVVSLIMRFLKQPLIIGHIFTGIIAGPSVLHLIENKEVFDIFSSIGITLLLFVVGLGLNPKIIKEVGKVALVTGVGQVIGTTILGMVLTFLFSSISNEEAIFVGVAMAFSSTIIILKLLSDKKEQSRLHGKISIGILLVQDILATIALLFLSASGENGLSLFDLLLLIIKGGWIAIGLYIVSTQILPRMNSIIAGSQEFLFLFAVAWGFGVSSLFDLAGFSIEVGALFAGVALAGLPYAQEMSARLRPLRDFFIVVFFITLGAGLSLDNIDQVVVPAVILSLSVLIFNPLVILAILGLLGYTKRTSFQVGIAMAQISEFSLIFLILAQRQGYISDSLLTTMTLVGLITIAVSTYMIIYTDKLYLMFERHLKMFERRHTKSEAKTTQRYDMILFGYLKGGQEFAKTFSKIKKPYVVVDYDPEVIEHLEHDAVDYIYGDANDIELLDEIGVDKAKLVVSSITDYKTNRFLVSHIHEINKSIPVIAQADSKKEAALLYEAGATYVMIPTLLGSEKISNFIKKKGLSKAEFKKFGDAHLKSLGG